MLEEVDGCEMSLSSFVVAEYKGQPVAARGGWVEGVNEDNMPSAILKSNLFTYILPLDNVKKGQMKYDIVKDIKIDREKGAYQLENSYTNSVGAYIFTRLLVSRIVSGA